jgi:hypothetical protein
MPGAQILMEKGNVNNARFLAQSFEAQPDSIQFAPVFVGLANSAGKSSAIAKSPAEDRDCRRGDRCLGI